MLSFPRLTNTEVAAPSCSRKSGSRQHARAGSLVSDVSEIRFVSSCENTRRKTGNSDTVRGEMLPRSLTCAERIRVLNRAEEPAAFPDKHGDKEFIDHPKKTLGSPLPRDGNPSRPTAAQS